MPPLPSTTQTLTTRLSALSDSNKSIQQLIQRLAKLDFQPGSQPLNTEQDDVRLELSAEIHESLKGIEEDLDLLRLEVEDFVNGGVSGTGRDTARRRDSARDNNRESERSRVAVLLARLTEDLKLSRSQFRKAQLTAKHNADRSKLKERELLFSNLQSGSSTPTSSHRRCNNPQLAEGEIVAQASTDVTAALRRTHQLMQSELSRSRFAQETLEQSTAALEDLGERYTDLNTLLASSRALVTTLLKSTKSDTWYLETTFYVLATTLVWLIFRRWLYGPISLCIIWPLKILVRVAFAIAPIGASPANLSVTSTPSQPPTSLIVKSSATGEIPKRPINENNPKYVRVGGGGRGYSQDRDPSPPHSLSQSVGQMAEQSQQQQEAKHPQLREQNQQQQDNSNEPVVRGDGTVLQKSDRPRNPKKKMWDEGVESAKFEEKQRQAERQLLQEQAAAEGEGKRKRDEL